VKIKYALAMANVTPLRSKVTVTRTPGNACVRRGGWDPSVTTLDAQA